MMSYPVDDDHAWTRSTALLDLEDPRIRLRAQALTQLCHSKREAALATYAYVKRIPFSKTYKLRLRTAREVLDQRSADADDKATLLVALLRSSGMSARLHYIGLRGEVLRGLTSTISSIARPVVQTLFQDGWCETDTYIFDASYVAGARERLASEGREWGYGIGRNGHTLWSGSADAYLTGPLADLPSTLELGSLGYYHDPQHFLDSPGCKEQFGGWTRLVQWNLLAGRMAPTIAQVRLQGAHGANLSPL